MTDCPICYDKITIQTGVCTLNCSHSYHLRCIVKWISTNESCPCCRNEINQYEKIQDILYENDTISTDSDEIAALRWFRTPSGNWIIDNPIPTLELPPHIMRLPYIIDSHAEENISRSLHLAAARIQAHISGYLTRKNIRENAEVGIGPSGWW